jgi:hypothetical protein
MRSVRYFPVSIWERSDRRDTRVKGCYIETETLPYIGMEHIIILNAGLWLDIAAARRGAASQWTIAFTFRLRQYPLSGV